MLPGSAHRWQRPYWEPMPLRLFVMAAHCRLPFTDLLIVTSIIHNYPIIQ